ncbi:hypothetical protein IJ531_04540, partial [bacterium]|nr:hypothetical protein [bacterium]
GSQGAYILPAIVEMTQKFKEIDYKIVTTIPFIFEGQKRRIRALATLGELCILGCAVGKNLFIYDDNEIMDLLSKKDDVHDAFLAVDKKVSDIIKMLLELK